MSEKDGARANGWVGAGDGARNVRVLQVVSSSAIGGIERMLPRLREPLLREGIEIEAAGLAGDGPAASLARRCGLAFHAVAARHPIEQILALRAIVRAGRFDVLHAYGTRAIAASRIAAHLAAAGSGPRPRVVTGLLSTNADRSRAQWIAERVTRIGNDLHVANAAAVARARIASDRLAPASVCVVHDGIEVHDDFASASGVAPLRAAVRRSLGIDANDPVALCVANLRPMKGHATLLDAFTHVREEHPGARLLLAGEDRMGGAVQRRAAAAGLAGSVLFLGPRPDVDALLAASDLFVLSSDWEGLPISILEAMRARRPVVATAVSGIPEAIRDGIEGILVPPRDPEALARAIAALFADPTRAARMGEAGRARFEAQFTTRRSAAALAAVYRNLLARQRYRSHAATGRKGMSARFACEPLAATAMESEER